MIKYRRLTKEDHDWLKKITRTFRHEEVSDTKVER